MIENFSSKIDSLSEKNFENADPETNGTHSENIATTSKNFEKSGMTQTESHYIQPLSRTPL